MCVLFLFLESLIDLVPTYIIVFVHKNNILIHNIHFGCVLYCLPFILANHQSNQVFTEWVYEMHM